jgi:hypothetical protein
MNTYEHPYNIFILGICFPIALDDESRRMNSHHTQWASNVSGMARQIRKIVRTHAQFLFSILIHTSIADAMFSKFM